MKKLNYLIYGLLVTSLIFSGCGKIEEATNIDFDASYDTNLNAVVSAVNRSASFEAKSTIDPLADANVAKYVDNIKNYNVQQIKAEVTSVSKEATLVSADLDIFTDVTTASWKLENKSLTVGSIINLGNENGQWNKVNQIFGQKKSFTIQLAGETDEGDITFTLKVTIVTKITASPL